MLFTPWEYRILFYLCASLHNISLPMSKPTHYSIIYFPISTVSSSDLLFLHSIHLTNSTPTSQELNLLSLATLHLTNLTTPSGSYFHISLLSLQYSNQQSAYLSKFSGILSSKLFKLYSSNHISHSKCYQYPLWLLSLIAMTSLLTPSMHISTLLRHN